MSFDFRTEEEPPPPAKRSTAADVGWVLLFIDGLLLGCSALFWISRGHFFDRGFYEAVTRGAWSTASALMPSLDRASTAAVRFAGLLGALTSVFVIAIATTSYRRGERWAWYVMLALPTFAVLDFSLTAGYEAITATSLAWDGAVAGLALMSLLISYRTFFAPMPPVREEQPAPA